MRVRVRKTENGTSREMALDKKVWNRVSTYPLPEGTRYEYLGEIPDVVLSKSVVLTPEVKKEEPKKESGYSNHTLEELKEAAQNAGIKGFQTMKEETLRKKLSEQ